MKQMYVIEEGHFAHLRDEIEELRDNREDVSTKLSTISQDMMSIKANASSSGRYPGRQL